MWETFKEKIKGWKTMIWSGFLVLLGLVATALSALNGDMIASLLPDKYKIFVPLLLSVVGAVTGTLRVITTGPVGVKGDEEPDPAANVKAGD